MNTTSHLILIHHTVVQNETPEWKWLLFSVAALAAFGSLVGGSFAVAIALALVPAAIIALDTRSRR
jgi:hypothetical protein